MAELLTRPGCSLVAVNLNNNRLGDRGAIALADALRRNSALAALTLQKNGLGYKSGPAFLEALAHNSVLQHLDLQYNNLGKSQIAQIEAALKGGPTKTGTAGAATATTGVGSAALPARGPMLHSAGAIAGSAGGVQPLGKELSKRVTLSTLGPTIDYTELDASQIRAAIAAARKCTRKQCVLTVVVNSHDPALSVPKSRPLSASTAPAASSTSTTLSLSALQSSRSFTPPLIRLFLSVFVCCLLRIHTSQLACDLLLPLCSIH